MLGPWVLLALPVAGFPLITGCTQQEAQVADVPTCSCIELQVSRLQPWCGGGNGTGHGWGFRQLFPGHPGFLSNSEFLWPLATSLISTLKCRLHSPFSPGIQTSTGTSLRRSLVADVYFTRSFLLGQLGLSGHPLCIHFFLHSSRGVVGHLKAVQQLGRPKRDS